LRPITEWFRCSKPIGILLKAAVIVGIFLIFCHPIFAGEEMEDESKERESLDRDMSKEEKLYFPDDETGGLMDEFAFLEDADVVESAARHRQEIGMSPSAITVITREDIETSGVSTIPDLLRIVPGMEVLFLGIASGTPAGRLHYSEGNYHYLVLIDGREANIEVVGQTFWEVLPISLEDVERIEIIRGPASALYGANALSGVISITTRAVSDKTSGWAMVQAGEVGLARLEMRASTRLGDWGFSANGGMDFLGTFRDLHASSVSIWKLRALAERRWSESVRLLVDGSAAGGRGPRATSLGNLDIDYNQASLRLAYESEKLRARLYWFYLSVNVGMDADLNFGGMRLAEVKPALIDNHTVDAEVQWTLPEFWDPLLVIVGGGGRFFWLGSDDLLDGETFADIGSSNYHQAGVSHWEGRGSTFVHAELAVADWSTVTIGTRLDYNTETGWFLSPRLAVVFKPAAGQFVRLSAARSFRKPAYLEKGVHLDVSFPDDSPISGGDRDIFREFMTRVIGNEDVGNEVLTSFEAGYLGTFLNEKLSVTLDFYCNLYRSRNDFIANLIPGEQGLPDLKNSTYQYWDTGNDLDIIGSELAFRYQPIRYISLLAVWTHKEYYYHETESWGVRDPRNFITLGGRFRTGAGLLGSLFVFTRSEFSDVKVENPAGLLEEPLQLHVDEAMLLLGKLGWSWSPREGTELEAGVKIFQPISPFSSPHFRARDKGGGETPDGKYYGAVLLGRMVSIYLQGSF
jgi:outer membrane receptor protein involved in Fe transport